MGTRTRQRYFKPAYVIAAVVAAAAAGGGYYGYRQRAETRRNVEAAIGSWYGGPQLMTQLMMERYGPPDVFTPEAATWRERGPWKRIVVRGHSPDSYLEQTVGYQAPPEARARLSEFGHGIRFDAANEELTATSSQESMNILALNLADEVAAGKRSPDQARDFHLSTTKLAVSGKSSPYLEGFRFKPYRPAPELVWRRD